MSPMWSQVREFKEAFGFFNAHNPGENELSAHDVYDVMTKFEPNAEVDIKVSARASHPPQRERKNAWSPRPRRGCASLAHASRPYTAQEVEALIREVDTDDTGTIDFPKFLTVMGRTSAPTDSLTDQDDVMTDAFQFFCDVGGDEGKPSFGEDELAQVMDLMGENMSGEEMRDMLNFLDPNGTGEVTFEDFMDVMKKI